MKVYIAIYDSRHEMKMYICIVKRSKTCFHNTPLKDIALITGWGTCRIQILDIFTNVGNWKKHTSSKHMNNMT